MVFRLAGKRSWRLLSSGGGGVDHLQARPACPRRLRSAADALAFLSPSSGLRTCCRWWAARVEVARLCPGSAERRSWPGRRSHTPSHTINQVGISLISYGGEQPGKASTPAKKIWTRRRSTRPAGSGEEAVPASPPLLFIILPPANSAIRSLLLGFPHDGTNIPEGPRLT